jgi:hypothetical protein
MPNLEYSVRFVLASDSTAQIDAVLTKMRETGSTITVKVDADTSGFDAEMKKVEAELAKVEQTTQKMSRSASKTSGMYKILAKEISGALNQFKATGNLSGAQAEFARIEQSVRAFGASMEGNEAGMQEYYKLLNMNASAVRALDKETNNSSGVMKARQAEERALAEEVKRSAGVLRARAQSAKFDAKQQADANRMTSDSVTGVIRALQRLSVEGRGTAEEIQTYFGRTAVTGRDLQVTVRDLSAAFAQQRAVVEASTLPLKQREALLRSIIINERDTAQSIRTVNRTLAQQGQGVGDTSYAMMSFTRLLEDVPYGFRGFANNIQPTIYGLVQMNSTTEMLATRFRGLHGRELPLAARAMINLKRAVTGPVNQLLLLTSVVAVAGTMIERWSQQANKAKQETKELGDEFLRLYDVTKGDNPLDVDYSQSIQGLEDYAQALESVADESTQTFLKLNTFRGAIGPVAQQVAEFFIPALKEQASLATKNLDTASGLSKEARDRLKTLQTEAEVQKFILESETIRAAVQRQINERRVQSANEEIFKTQDLIDIEKVRQAQGEQAALRLQSTLRVQAIQADGTLNAEQKEVLLKKETIDLELELLRLAGRRTNEAEKTKAEYESTVQTLQRQLQDETQMFSVQRLRVEQAREIADLEARHAEAKAKGAEIAVGLLEQEKALINQIFGTRIQRETQSSALVTKNLTDQFQITSKLLQAEQAYLLGQERLGTDLEFQAMEMEYQLELKQQLTDLDSEGISDLTEKAVREAVITNELKAQYRIRLLQRSAQSRETVDRFLGGNESEEVSIQRSKNEALLANETDFLSRRQQALQQFAGFQVTLGATMERYRVMELERMKAIEAKASAEINAIKVKTYTEGAMMIVGALSQLNDSSEAVNKAQFERQKRFSASLATINTLLAITQVLADPNMGTFLKFAQASAMAITGFAQVRQILGTKYGNATTGGFNPQSQSQGFIESDVEARGSVNGTTNNFQPTMIVNVTGTVDKEGIAWAVMEGTDQINSRGVVLQ